MEIRAFVSFTLVTLAGTATAESTLDAEVDIGWNAAMVSSSVPSIGQVTGLAQDEYGNMFVLHRGSRIWDANSFTYDHRFTQTTTIQDKTLVVLGPDGSFSVALAASQFYMPYGIAVSSQRIWITDAGIHQVISISYDPTDISGSAVIDLVYGREFEPGTTLGSFCKPAGILAFPRNSAVVANGICGNRLVHIDNGIVVGDLELKFGPAQAQIVSALAYDDTKREIYALDPVSRSIFIVNKDSFQIRRVLTSGIPDGVYGLAVVPLPGCGFNAIAALDFSATLYYIKPHHSGALVDVVHLSEKIDFVSSLAIRNNSVTIGRSPNNAVAAYRNLFRFQLVGQPGCVDMPSTTSSPVSSTTVNNRNITTSRNVASTNPAITSQNQRLPSIFPALSDENIILLSVCTAAGVMLLLLLLSAAIYCASRRLNNEHKNIAAVPTISGILAKFPLGKAQISFK